MLPPGAIFEIKIHQNAFAAYWGSLQRSQTPWLVFRGPLRGRGGEGRKQRRGKGRRERGARG